MKKADREKALTAIGQRMRQRRQERQLTQERLAEAADVSKSFVSDIEAGSTAASGLVYLKIAQALDVTVQWLVTGQEASPSGTGSPGGLPPLVSAVAEERGWSVSDALDVAAALDSVVARRSGRGTTWEPSRDQVLQIARALGVERR